MSARWLPVAPVVAMLLLAQTSCSKREREGGAQTRPMTIGPSGEPRRLAAPAFALLDQDGNKVSLSDFPGRIVVLEWTNPLCPFVQRHYGAGTMLKLAEQYKDKGVVWLAVNSTAGSTAQQNQQWRQRQHIPYPVLDDSAGAVAKQYAAMTTPDMVVIDKAGQIAYRGAIDDDPEGQKQDQAVNYVRKALDEILAGRPVTRPETRPYGCTVKLAR